MVGGGSTRGVVAASSYEARQFGVRSAMPGRVASRLCPDGVFVRPRFARYREVSASIFAIFHSITDQVEGLSLDEAFLDVTQGVNAGQSITAIGRRLKQEIGEKTGLSASVGMAHNKLLAKLASDYDKPDGFVHVDPGQVQRFSGSASHSSFMGDRSTHCDAPARCRHLHRRAVCGVPRSISWLNCFGASGPDLARRAAGIDERPVKPSRGTPINQPGNHLRPGSDRCRATRTGDCRAGRPGCPATEGKSSCTHARLP